MYEGVGNAVVALWRGMIVLLCVFVPLGLWKLIDICIWIFNHVHIGLK